MFVSTVYEAINQGPPLGNPVNWNDGGKKALSAPIERLHGEEQEEISVGGAHE